MTAGLEGYLSVEHPSMGCVELFNSCRTLSYLRSANIPGVTAALDCETCCCTGFRDDYGTNPGEDPSVAPWFDPNTPASTQFLGLYGELTQGIVEVNDNSGVTQRRRRVTFTGRIVSTCDPGREYGYQWLRRMLEDDCRACTDLEATVFSLCGSDPDGYNPTEVVLPNPRPDPTIGYDCCAGGEEPLPLGDPPDVVTLPDSGMRRVTRIRYVPSSFQIITDGEEWPACYGCRVTFSFDIRSSTVHTDPVLVCVKDHDVFGPDELCCGCRAVCFTADVGDECDRCLHRDCRCATMGTQVNECTVPAKYSTDEMALCRYSAPLCHTRVSCITPPAPWTSTVPIITLASGDTATDVAVNIWEAHQTLPDPATCGGHDAYDRLEPLMTVGVHIPEGSVVTLDGRTGTAAMHCGASMGSANQFVSVCPSGGLNIPTICCNKRLWVTIDADCYNPPGPGFTASIELAGTVNL